MQRLFYATRNDLLPVLEAVESRRALTYLLAGSFSAPPETFHPSAGQIPTLGAPAPTRDAVGGHTYLVLPKAARLQVREVAQVGGGVRYLVDQLVNPESITFTHGGFYSPTVLLHGRVATASQAASSKSLYRTFASELAIQFTKLRAFYVGPEALDHLHSGCRLTISADSSAEYDLVA